MSRKSGENWLRRLAGALVLAYTLKLREGKPVSWENIDAFCRLLEIQPGDLLEYKPDTTENE